MTAKAQSFLSRLAPSAATAPYAVRAALPARFESNASLRIDEQLEAVANPDIAPWGMDTPVGDRVARVDRAAPVLRVDAADTGAATQAEPMPLAAERQGIPPPTISLKYADDPEPRPVVGYPTHVPLAQPRTIVAPQTATRRPDREPPESVRPPPNFQFPTASQPGGPLRPGTVMERELAAPRAEPDVVQVTIDRIDIRMPSEVGHAAGRTEPPRRSAPTISLSDYLRRADPGSRSRG